MDERDAVSASIVSKLTSCSIDSNVGSNHFIRFEQRIDSLDPFIRNSLYHILQNIAFTRKNLDMQTVIKQDLVASFQNPLQNKQFQHLFLDIQPNDHNYGKRPSNNRKR
ncbi:hypothetical protein [Sphingobacterium daejeonense]|uniref:hypothetical protein n=1 Tax=Sphingobacterium daejeonense TaxID=371142 RepID=UPI0010C35EAA|nr:hypothetical protein [Sphingobacterium daejeonense]VTP96007.1 Uncharacterised protein [Sphingobacterium daejeonense]